MNIQNIAVSSTDIELGSAPIVPEWILEGLPQARNRLLFKSRDGISTTMLWDCTAGIFNWFYNCDETIHVLEGGVTLTTAEGTREVRAGDAVFFPAGSWATWRVDSYIRKVAFLRHPLPLPASWVLRAWRRYGSKKPSPLLS